MVPLSFPGTSGSPGMLGFEGKRGNQGVEGSSGLKGETGLPGEIGQKGLKGYIGEKGDCSSVRKISGILANHFLSILTFFFYFSLITVCQVSVV